MFAPSLQTTCCAVQVSPPLKLRRRTVSMSPVSLAEFLRPSQEASRVPFVVSYSAGMR